MIYLVPANEARSGGSRLVTVQGQVLVARTPEEDSQVPERWVRLDMDSVDMITVTEWIQDQVGAPSA